jgi:hypothetical protein
MGITAEAAQPVTCAVCHDPHDVGLTSGDPNTAKVRITGDTAMLPAGFQAVGVGRGALCITCHNTRNGARNDALAIPVDVLDQAPHYSAQGDVLMGQNAYFVTVGDRAAHSYLADTCATCHMERTPPPAEFSYNLGGTNHAFKASTKICADCHGAYDGGTLKEATHHRLLELEKALIAAIEKEIAAQTKAGNTVVLVGRGAGGADVVISAASTVKVDALAHTGGRQAMKITVNGTTYADVRLSGHTAVKGAGGITTGTLLTSAAGQLIAKAGWNYYLLEDDASMGIHNPSFTNEVINASLNALK